MSSTLAEQLCSTMDAFLDALCANVPSMDLLQFFSKTTEVVIQHAPARCPRPQASRLTGLNAVRSYFDILATHWARSNMQIHGAPYVQINTRTVSVEASVTWTWRQSRRRWTEDFTCAIAFDDNLKIISFIIRTNSPPDTCVMMAKDIDPLASEARKL